MATFTITNLSSNLVGVGDFYGVDLQPAGTTGDSKTLTGRDPNELTGATRLQKLVADGIVTVGRHRVNIQPGNRYQTKKIRNKGGHKKCDCQ